MAAMSLISFTGWVILLAPAGTIYSAQAREFSKAGQIFQQVKNGVVTVFTSVSFGSGFLVDQAGLIVTNSHVVNQGTEHLRVKFGPKQIVEAKVLVNDREHDIAILQVNLTNITNAKVVEIFEPEDGELALVGEKVIAIGTPIDRETMEKTLTEGVVSKVSDKVIFHDAFATNGNSGGPLFNFDGKVVGINAFGVRSYDSPTGAIPITFVLEPLRQARAKDSKPDRPAPNLLPDTPDVPYPISKLLREEPDFLKGRKQKKYNLSSSYFNLSILTPPQLYARTKEAEVLISKRRIKRGKKKGFTISDDEYDYKNLKYYDCKKPVVTIIVFPKEKLTTGCMIAQSTGLLAATTLTVFTAGIAAPLMAAPLMYNKTEIKKDFLKLRLLDSNDNLVATPISTGRKLTNYSDFVVSDYYYKEFVDRSYVGIYTFDAKAFETDEKLRIVIDVEGEKKDRTIRIPERVKTLIIKDFEPYWKHVTNLKEKRLPAEENTVRGELKESNKLEEGENIQKREALQIKSRTEEASTGASEDEDE